jgi:hypothetical protein
VIFVEVVRVQPVAVLATRIEEKAKGARVRQLCYLVILTLVTKSVITASIFLIHPVNLLGW